MLDQNTKLLLLKYLWLSRRDRTRCPDERASQCHLRSHNVCSSDARNGSDRSPVSPGKQQCGTGTRTMVPRISCSVGAKMAGRIASTGVPQADLRLGQIRK